MTYITNYYQASEWRTSKSQMLHLFRRLLSRYQLYLQKKYWWGVEGWKAISCQVAQTVPRVKRTQPKDDPFHLSILVLPKFFHDLNPLVSFSIKWIGRNSHLLIITFHRWEIEVYFCFLLFFFHFFYYL